MACEEALELMRSAWATRRASFDAGPAEKLVLMTQAKQDLAKAVAMCRDRGSPVSQAQAVHLLANVELDTGVRVAPFGVASRGVREAWEWVVMLPFYEE